MTSTPTATDTRYLACQTCRHLHPLAAVVADGDEDAGAALQAFQAEHDGHPLTVVWRESAALQATGPVWDPMSVMTFPVTDGHASYLVTVERPSIDEPRLYRLIPGELAAMPATVSIEQAHLRRGLDRELYPHAIRPSKLDSFLGAVRAVLARIDADALDTAFDDADDPAVSIARLPDTHYAELIESCTRIFDASELPRVNGFLAANRFEDGLLALRVRHDYRLAA